jgi:hypothetical protein
MCPEDLNIQLITVNPPLHGILSDFYPEKDESGQAGKYGVER